jgi:hypothetical protein
MGLIKVLIFLAGAHHAVTYVKDEMYILFHIVGGHFIYARMGKL